MPNTKWVGKKEKEKKMSTWFEKRKWIQTLRVCLVRWIVWGMEKGGEKVRNEKLECLVGEENRVKNWWGSCVFFLGPPKCYLPNLGKKLKRKWSTLEKDQNTHRLYSVHNILCRVAIFRLGPKSEWGLGPVDPVQWICKELVKELGFNEFDNG